MYTLWIFFILAGIGYINAWYLWHQHRNTRPLVCPFGSDCDAVVGSKWSRIGGVRNEVAGMIMYALLATMLAIGILIPAITAWMILGVVVVTFIGFLASLFLTGVQIFVIKEWCFYCLLSSVINIVLFLLVLAML